MSNHEEGHEPAKSGFSGLSSKSSFLVGLVGGIMMLCTIGFFVVLSMYIGETSDSTNNESEVAGAAVQANVNTNTNAAPAAPTKVDFNVTDNDYIRGNPDAKITLVEYSDYQCPYCSSFHKTGKQLIENYPDDVRWVYRHFPLDSLHPEARSAAIAAECIAEQKGDEGFWEYTDALYENQSDIGTRADELFEELAQEVGANLATFKDCFSSEKTADAVDEDYQSGLESGVRGTPGNYLNGVSLGGAVPYGQLESAVKQLQ
ncbi:DsbA family protein [Patescibacteria group bacterium]|nr:DsbA family protein [Patescibacteria group bacterium]MBU1890933.1 DsbA family protein [Patescibacteria group bacterium]